MPSKGTLLGVESVKIPVQMTMQSVLENVLIGCISSDKGTRKSAEAELQKLKSTSDYWLQLLSILDSQNEQARQLAIVNIKNDVEQCWEELDQHSQSVARKVLFRHLGDPVATFRSNVALTISKIAHLDYHEKWTDFFTEIIALLDSLSGHVVHGAIQVLNDFVRDDLTDLSFPHVAPQLMPKLFSLFSNDQVPMDIRAQCVAILREFGDMIYMIKEGDPTVVKRYLEPLLKMWMDGFLQVLQSELTFQNSPIKDEVLKTVVKLVRAFPKQTADVVPVFMELVWNELVRLQQIYQQSYVQDGTDLFQGDEHFESIIFSALDYIQTIARKKSVRPMITQSLKEMLRVLMTYLQITTTLQETWSQDMNQFIQDDDDDAISSSVRIAVEQCLANIMDGFPDDAPQALFHTCIDLFVSSDAQKETGNIHWWKGHEACLYAIGRFPSEFEEAAPKKGLDMDHVMRTVLEDIKYDSLPFLQGRALWFASQFASSLPHALIGQFLASSVQALHSDTVHNAVRIFALKSIRGFLCAISNQDAKPYQASIIEGLLKLADGAKEDCLILLLETFVLAIKVDDEITSQYEDYISKMLLQLWNNSAQDVFIMELLQELFTGLSANKFMAVSFQTRMFPVLVSSLSPQMVRDNPQITFTSLDLITSLVKNVSDPFPSVYTTDMYPNVINVLLAVQDSGLLQNGQELLKVLVHRDFDGILNLQVNGRSGLDLLLEFISKMLAPSESESSAIFLGSLITKLIQKGGNHLVPYLPQLLTAVIHRLNSAKMPAFIETLVLIFCNLIETQCQTVISFLHEIHLNDCTGLELFLRAFCDCFADLNGVYTIKLGTMAMIMLLSSRDSRVYAAQVKGELIVNNSNRIITRSKAKAVPDQYTMVPFPVKAIGLILDEYNSQSSAKDRDALNASLENDGFDSEEYDTCSEQEEDLFDEASTDDFEDEDLKSSAIYQVDLPAAIKQFVKESHQLDPNGFQSTSQFLSHHHKLLLEELISK